VNRNHSLTIITSTLKKGAACSSETLVPIYKNKRYHNPEDHTLNSNLREFVKTYKARSSQHSSATTKWCVQPLCYCAGNLLLLQHRDYEQIMSLVYIR
jgi:hypothetical protein